jgi:hypothetical protein
MKSAPDAEGQGRLRRHRLQISVRHQSFVLRLNSGTLLANKCYMQTISTNVFVYTDQRLFPNHLIHKQCILAIFIYIYLTIFLNLAGFEPGP